MGDSYGPWDEQCPSCGELISVYYAESCGITNVQCEYCKTEYDIIVDFTLQEKTNKKVVDNPAPTVV